MSRFASLLVIAVVACGPSTKGPHGGDDTVDASTNGLPDAYLGPTGTVSGRVWMPNYGPGQVPAGQEIPVFGAQVSLTTTKLAPIPNHVYCEQCSDTPGTTSGHDGSFTLTAPPGTYILTIQKGQFRLEENVIVSEGSLALPAASTTLPSQYDPDHGAWIPKVAVAVGNYDAVEDILGKIGFGTMNGADDALVSGAGEHGSEIDLYTYGGSPSVQSLIGDITQLRKYHVIFFPCSTEMSSLDSWLAIQANLKTLRQYVNEGGKIYVTDWSGEFGDRPFPPQLTLGDSQDSVGTYDPKTLDGTLTTQGDSDGDLYDSEGAKAVDPDLAAWLGGQMAPDPNGSGMVSLIDPNNITVVDNWNWISKLTSVQVGVDSMGLPVYDDPKAWISGPRDSFTGDSTPHPLSVTYQPTGCGRVLYSTYQTSGYSSSDKHAGLTAQERVLLYLIMEIQVCNSIIVN
ncbi:MAG TPA: hypothetical protein VL463_00110 [Kofleriaceae bacterium]|nr:hypothetical protein [Kofleriaceae bacterium]